MNLNWRYLVGLMVFVPAALGQTWTYDPDSGLLPHEAGSVPQQLEFSNSSSFRGIVDIGGGDKVLQVNTGLSGSNNHSQYWQVNSGSDWNVDMAAGYTVEWNLRLDSTLTANPSSAVIVWGDTDTPYAIMRVYNATAASAPLGYKLVGLQTSSSGEVTVAVRNDSAFHNYRVDVQAGVANLYIDNYSKPVLSRPITSGSGVNEIRWGDQTGVDNGFHQTQRFSTWQSGLAPAIQGPNPASASNTLFLAHYNGNTANAGLDADLAVGSPASSATGGSVDAAAKFGAGSMNFGPGTLTYDTAGNLNVDKGTIEMWAKPADWAAGVYEGLFGLIPGAGDIRLQKTSGGQLQAYMAGGGQSWSLTSGSLVLSDDWHHIAWSWDFDVHQAALYVDGVVVANAISSTHAGGVLDYLVGVDPTFQVGSIQNGSADFNGLIDEFRISSIDLYQGMNFTPPSAPFIPEPATAGLMLAGTFLLSRRRRT